MQETQSNTFVQTCAVLSIFFLTALGCEAEQSHKLETTTVASQTAGSSSSIDASDAAIPSSVAIDEADEDLDTLMDPFVPAWVVDAVFYQIFPERFRNGDAANDPTRESLEPSDVSEKWAITPWTGDWYERADWEQEIGNDFFESGVFHRRYGGDLQGVLDKLDYLEDLGINAIYFNPVFYGRSLHKYDGASMHHIDPYFGPDPSGDLELIATETSDPKSWKWTAADKLFLDLVQQVHKRNMRLIIDGVFNHTGRDFFAFADLREKQQESQYVDWYIVQSFDNPETPQNEFRYKSWWGIDTLPEFADDFDRSDLHAGPKKYIFDVTRRWMDPDGDGDPADGIDGWRLDVANEVPSGFWKDWNSLVRELNPDAYTVGEFWGDATKHLIDGRFSATMNYHGFAYLVKGFLIDGRLTAHDFGMQLRQRMEEYPRPMRFALQNLIDSHDTDRVASMIVNANNDNYRQADRFDYDVSEVVTPRYNLAYSVEAPDNRDRQIQRMVALMQMTFVGAPMIYYGTESGMWGADDPCDRQAMVWADLQYTPQTKDPRNRNRKDNPIEFDQELFDFFRSVVQLRHDNSALRNGSFEVVAYDDDAMFIAFRRTSDEGSLIVAINRGEAPHQFTFDCEPNETWASIFTTSQPYGAVTVSVEGSQATASVPAMEAVVLKKSATAEQQSPE